MLKNNENHNYQASVAFYIWENLFRVKNFQKVDDRFYVSIKLSFIDLCLIAIFMGLTKIAMQ